MQKGLFPIHFTHTVLFLAVLVGTSEGTLDLQYFTMALAVMSVFTIFGLSICTEVCYTSLIAFSINQFVLHSVSFCFIYSSPIMSFELSE